MQNRTRKKQVVFRMSDKEFLQIKQKIKESGMSQQEYILNCCLNKEIINFNEIRDFIKEIKKVGNNVNQIARCCNEGKIPYKNEIEEMQRELMSVWQLLRQVIQKPV